MYHQVLNRHQKESIQNLDFYFLKIKALYQQWYGEHYYKDAFDNDLAFAINNGKPLYRHISPYILKNRKLFDLLQTISLDTEGHTYNMWCSLSYKKKQSVYIHMMDRIYEFI